MEHDELTRQIIGCAYRVFNAMGHGFLESVYEKCMAIELRRLGIRAECQYPIKVHYDGHEVGAFEADLFVEGVVIVELKAVRAVLMIHEVQLVNYLKATGIDVGLLINFAEQKVEVKRKRRLLPSPDDTDGF
jgi:GxxExxY protein